VAYDEGLAERIRGVLDERKDVSERRMFGGLASLVRGHMSVGIVLESDADLERWVGRGVAFATALPAKAANKGGSPPSKRLRRGERPAKKQ
jgi:hypothetical protein